MTLNFGSRHRQKIDWIILHYPVAPGCSAEWCKSYYERQDVRKSAHFAIDEHHIVPIVPCEYAAWHCAVKDKQTYCAATNYNSIGIDLMDRKMSCATKRVEDCDWYIPEETLERAANFISMLMLVWDIDIDHVIRHYDVTHKWCPRPLVGDDINSYYGISGNERWARFKAQIIAKLKKGV